MTNPWYRPLPIPTVIVDCNTQADLNAALGHDGYRIKLHGATEYVFNGAYNGVGVVIEGVGRIKIKGQLYLDLPDCYLLNCNGINQFTTRMTADRCGYINNIIEGDGITDGSAGILSVAGKDQLTYANNVRGYEHALYIQNKKDSIEFVAHNYLGDCVPNSGGRSVHAYTQQPDNTNSLHFIQNVFNGNEVLIGGEVNATMPLYNLLQENWAHEAGISLGYKRPECTDLIGNHLYNSILLRQHFVGDDVVTDDWSIVNGNEIWNDGAVHGYDHIRFATHNPNAHIRTVESWDNNKYYTPDYFRAPFSAGGVQDYVTGLAEWRSRTATAGKQFDTNSVEIIGPPPNWFWLIQNDYDANKAMLVVWGNRNVTFPRQATVANMKTPWAESQPITSGTFGVAGTLQTYIVRYQVATSCDLDEARRLLNEAHAKSNQKGVKNRITLALSEMEGC